MSSMEGQEDDQAAGASMDADAREWHPPGPGAVLTRPSLKDCRTKSAIYRSASVHLRKHEGESKSVIVSGWEASPLGSVVNLCSTIIGGGVLAIPLAGVWLSLVPFIVAVTLLGVVSTLACRMLLESAAHLKVQSYEDLMQKVLGDKAAVLLDLVILLRSVIVLSSILILMADFLWELAPAVLPALYDQKMTEELWTKHAAAMRALLLTAVAVLVVYPLSLMRSMNSLAAVSLLKLLCLAAWASLVAWKFVEVVMNGKLEPIRWFDFSWNFWRALPIVAFGYHCQNNLFLIYEEMKDPNLTKGTPVVASAYAFCGFFFTLIGVCGYLTFPTSQLGNYLKNFEGEESWTLLFLRAGLLIVLAFTYPLQIFAARLAAFTLLWSPNEGLLEFAGSVGLKFGCSNVDLHKGNGHEKLSWRCTVGITTSIFVVTLAVALLTDDLAFVIGLAGSIFTACLSMVFPALIYWKVLDAQSNAGNSVSFSDVEGRVPLLAPAGSFEDALADLDHNGQASSTQLKDTRWKRLEAMGLLAVGFFVGVVGLVVTFLPG